MSKLRIVILVILGLLIALYLFRNSIIVSLYYAQKKPEGPVEKLPFPDLDPRLEQELTAYLKAHFQSPEAYIINKFRDHDIVFLGEAHRIRHDVLLVQRMIPILYRNGIHNLGMEFACRRDQPLIDSLLNAPQYDPAVANRILFNGSIYWNYREYADIFKVAWELNHSLPDSAIKFRVVGLNAFTDWSYVHSTADLRNPEIMAKVSPEGSGDRVMGETVLNVFVNHHQKALIYSGLHHAFTRYRQPRLRDHKVVGYWDDRMGNIVYQAIGDRACTICLHHWWWSARNPSQEFVYPADGIIDTLFHKLGPDYYPVGFDTRATPFGKLTGKSSIYHYGHPNFTLSDLCDGYIFTKPFSEYRGVHHIHGFINEGNMELARQRIHNLNRKNSFLWHFLSPEAVDTLFYSDAKIEWFYRQFK